MDLEWHIVLSSLKPGELIQFNFYYHLLCYVTHYPCGLSFPFLV